MAFHAWNPEGKKDFAEDYTEYEICKKFTSSSNGTLHISVAYQHLI